MLIKLITKHPLATAFMTCLLLFFVAGMFFGEPATLKNSISFLIVSFILFLANNTNFQRLTFAFAVLLLSFTLLLISATEQIIFMAELLIVFTFWYINKKEKNTLILCIIYGAFLLHLFYIQNTPVKIRQHDLNGIILYMQLIVKDGLNWQNFDPWYMYYLFHQPLHFLISGYIYLTEISFWHSQTLALNNLQYLSLFYVTGATIIAAKFFMDIGFTEKTYYALLLLLSFNPSLALISGYISDDAPLLFWSMAVIYFVWHWYAFEKTYSLIMAAICFGLGTLTKLSMLMLVPAISFLFLYKLLITTDKAKILKQLSLFILIAVPLSLIWVIRNHITYDMPFSHIPDTSPQGQNFLHLTLGERLSDFSMLFKPFINVPHDVDANIWLALIKTELFGEWNPSLLHKNIVLPAEILYMLNIFLKFSALSGCFYLLYQGIRYHNKENILGYFFIIIYITLWGYSFKYALDYPYACSTDYRLFIQLMLPETVILGLLSRYNSTQSTVLLAISVLYAISSLYIYVFGI